MTESSNRAVTEASAAFALALYSELAGPAGNLLFSPASITAALAMVWAGSQGETATELLQALRLPQDPEVIRAILSAISSQSISFPGCEIARANALWVDQRSPLLPAYLERFRRDFGSAAEQADFVEAAEVARQAINAWVAEQTKGYIQDLIAPDILGPLTRLVLINALYFKGAWAAQFDPSKTRSRPFHRVDKEPVDVPLMSRTGDYRLYVDKELQAVELPYQGDALSMIVIMPSKRDGLRDLTQKLDAARLQHIFEQIEDAEPEEMVVCLPRFCVHASFELSDALHKLGARSAFEETADFSGMIADRVHISTVLHKAFMDVTEEGTEATVVTAGEIAIAICELFVFQADHPFLFVIRDTRSGIVLFLGCLMDPSA